MKKILAPLGVFVALILMAPLAWASEADLVIPNLALGNFFGFTAQQLLMAGVAVSALGILVGLSIFSQVKKLPVHSTLTEISELIFETCKTYLQTQGKFILQLWLLVAAIVVFYFMKFRGYGIPQISIILIASLVGIAGSYFVSMFGIRINNYANSRTAFASLKGKPYAVLLVPLKSGISIGILLVSLELVILLSILLFIPSEYAGNCFLGFAIGESLGASVLRIAGGIFTKIADIGSDLMKIVFNIKEDDARNPGVIADCAGDNAGDSVGPTADGFETYGVTAVALITFILKAVGVDEVKIQLLVWMFVLGVVMMFASVLAYYLNAAWVKSKFQNVDKINFESPLTSLVWVSSILSISLTFVVSYFLIPSVQGDGTMWWKLASIISCGTLAGALIPEMIKVFTSTNSGHVKEVVEASREGGASLNVLAGLTAGNFSCYWMGFLFIALMGAAYFISEQGLGVLMKAPAIFSFGLLAFGFLAMAPVTIAVDSYGPVTDNAQSVYELSLIETRPGIKEDIKKQFGFEPNFDKAKDLLEENDGAGNTFKATSKPVLIGTAVVGATTMIFSIILILTNGLVQNMDKLSLMHPPFLLGLIAGGAVIYWFTGASTQAVSTGAYRAVAFIKKNMKLDGAEKASVEDSKKVVAICTEYAQKGMFNIFLTVFFSSLAFACLEPFFFIGYLISIALFGLFQALFMANAGGAWDNAKKVVEVELKQKGTPLHAACVVGDTVGDPFKDTSSVAMNPVIKFTTLFGLLALELALELPPRVNMGLFVVFFAISAFFVHRSFYGMRIKSND
ncbi:MAG: sodium-translocating pyrophosphatase [Deltaproteobacteria bacterium]|nr:sodium-translocating pyrophosphatase [Deltaproteobacteria bacterium]